MRRVHWIGNFDVVASSLPAKRERRGHPPGDHQGFVPIAWNLTPYWVTWELWLEWERRGWRWLATGWRIVSAATSWGWVVNSRRLNPPEWSGRNFRKAA